MQAQLHAADSAAGRLLASHLSAPRAAHLLAHLALPLNSSSSSMPPPPAAGAWTGAPELQPRPQPEMQREREAAAALQAAAAQALLVLLAQGQVPCLSTCAAGPGAEATHGGGGTQLHPVLLDPQHAWLGLRWCMGLPVGMQGGGGVPGNDPWVAAGRALLLACLTSADAAQPGSSEEGEGADACSRALQMAAEQCAVAEQPVTRWAGVVLVVLQGEARSGSKRKCPHLPSPPTHKAYGAPYAL